MAESETVAPEPSWKAPFLMNDQPAEEEEPKPTNDDALLDPNLILFPQIKPGEWPYYAVSRPQWLGSHTQRQLTEAKVTRLTTHKRAIRAGARPASDSRHTDQRRVLQPVANRPSQAPGCRYVPSLVARW